MEKWVLWNQRSNDSPKKFKVPLQSRQIVVAEKTILPKARNTQQTIFEIASNFCPIPVGILLGLIFFSLSVAQRGGLANKGSQACWGWHKAKIFALPELF